MAILNCFTDILYARDIAILTESKNANFTSDCYNLNVDSAIRTAYEHTFTCARLGSLELSLALMHLFHENAIECVLIKRTFLWFSHYAVIYMNQEHDSYIADPYCGVLELSLEDFRKPLFSIYQYKDLFLWRNNTFFMDFMLDYSFRM